MTTPISNHPLSFPSKPLYLAHPVGCALAVIAMIGGCVAAGCLFGRLGPSALGIAGGGLVLGGGILSALHYCCPPVLWKSDYERWSDTNTLPQPFATCTTEELRALLIANNPDRSDSLARAEDKGIRANVITAYNSEQDAVINMQQYLDKKYTKTELQAAVKAKAQELMIKQSSKKERGPNDEKETDSYPLLQPFATCTTEELRALLLSNTRPLNRTVILETEDSIRSFFRPGKQTEDQTMQRMQTWLKISCTGEALQAAVKAKAQELMAAQFTARKDEMAKYEDKGFYKDVVLTSHNPQIAFDEEAWDESREIRNRASTE